jgi:hypothetical protein
MAVTVIHTILMTPTTTATTGSKTITTRRRWKTCRSSMMRRRLRRPGHRVSGDDDSEIACARHRVESRRSTGANRDRNLQSGWTAGRDVGADTRRGCGACSSSVAGNYRVRLRDFGLLPITQTPKLIVREPWEP